MRLATGIKQQNGTFRFEVAAPGMAAAVVIAQKIEPDKKVANGPDWMLFHAGERCGALWKTLPRSGGEEYLEGNLESPAFPAGKIRVAVFRVKDEKRRGELDLVWSPPRGESGGGSSREASAASEPASCPSQPADAGDDEIPF